MKMIAPNSISFVRSAYPFDVDLVLTDELKIQKIPEQTIEEALQIATENRVELKAQEKREQISRAFVEFCDNGTCTFFKG